MTGRELLWEQNELPTMVSIIRVASAKSRSMSGASHQPAFMSSCLTISQMWQPYLPSSRLFKTLCSMTPYDWANGRSVDFF